MKVVTMKAKTNVFDDFFKSIADEYTTIAAEGKSCAEFSGYVDTGCYILNGLLSGSLYGGMVNNKITALAGKSATGKTYIALGIVKNFLDADPNAIVLYYDTEAAVPKKLMEDRGIDTKRVMISEPETLEVFKVHCVKAIDKYIKREEKPPLLIVIDSLGMLASDSEMAKALDGKSPGDMGQRAKIVKGIFRTLTLRLGKAGVPLLVTNHTYEKPDQNAPEEVAGGGGLKYAAHSIILLSKALDKEGEGAAKETVGINIRARTTKSRVSRENAVVHMSLKYATGLNKWYGLLQLAEKYEIIKKSGKQYLLPDGKKVWGKTINDDPEKYFTKDIMKQLEDAAKKEFTYGK